MEHPPEEAETFRRLQAQINAAHKAAEPESRAHSPAGHAMRMGVDLVSGTCVGSGVGYALDRWLESLPWFLLAGFCLGLAAGVRLMMQTARQVETELAAEAENEKK